MLDLGSPPISDRARHRKNLERRKRRGPAQTCRSILVTVAAVPRESGLSPRAQIGTTDVGLERGRKRSFKQTEAKAAIGHTGNTKCPSFGHLPINLLFLIDHRLQLAAKTQLPSVNREIDVG